MSTYKELNSDKLTFIEEGHKYYAGDKELTSVTTYVGKLFKPFDAKGLAKTIADGFKQRNGTKWKKKLPITDEERKKATQKYWLQAWRDKADYGTFVHEQLEEFCKEPLDIEDNEKMTKTGIRYLEDEGLACRAETKPYKIYPEARLYSEKWGLAGTVDLLAIKEDGSVLIGDWKTNNKFTVKPYEKGDRGIKPSTKHLGNSKLNVYALQIMTYTYLLKTEYGITPTSLHIIHLTDNKYTVYEVEYDEALVESVLNEKIKNENP